MVSGSWIALVLVISWIQSVDSGSCALFRNRIYQTTNQLPGRDPFYSILSLTSGGTFVETNNIADGNHSNTVNADLSFNVHQGRFHCPSRSQLRLISMGYIYKTASLPSLQENGGVAVHQYRLNFRAESNKQCSGTLKFAFYAIGTNPFDPNNEPTFVSDVLNVTCVLQNTSGYSIPSSLK